ncbi:MAG: hypothetical protein R2849_10725 [Thermomicrobiales bacterium]
MQRQGAHVGAGVDLRAGIPQPAYQVAFSPDSVLEAIEDIGYPAVLKPPVGLGAVDRPGERPTAPRR